MALLTVRTESALTEAGNSVLSASVFHGFRRILACVRAYSTLLGILRSAVSRAMKLGPALHCSFKQKKVKVYVYVLHVQVQLLRVTLINSIPAGEHRLVVERKQTCFSKGIHVSGSI